MPIPHKWHFFFTFYLRMCNIFTTFATTIHTLCVFASMSLMSLRSLKTLLTLESLKTLLILKQTTILIFKKILLPPFREGRGRQIMKKLFTFFLALLASVSTIYASGIEVDGIYYNFNIRTKTASVVGGYYFGSVIIPSSVDYHNITFEVTSIGEWAFVSCSGLTSITIPNSVTTIGEGAFSNCTGLTSVVIPNRVTTLSHTFEFCTGLKSVTIPNSVTNIGDFAFFGCTGLTSITIPNSVKNIGWGAFRNCTGLTSVTIPNSITNIDKEAFVGCSSLSSISIGNSVTSIGDNAFARCTGLTSVKIPYSVSNIGKAIFLGCTSLTSIEVDSNNSNYCSVDGILFNKFQTTLVAYPAGREGAYTIPLGVVSIGYYAFCECSSLASVTIPNSVTEIGEYAFYGCDKLVDVYCYATTPPVTKGEDTFSQYNTFLYVPCESKKAYMEDAVWGNFKYIECISSEGIEDVSSSSLQGGDRGRLILREGQVLILRNGKTYTMQGMVVN